MTSLGIGTATTVFGLVDGLVLKPLPVRDPDRLVYFASPSFSYPIFQEVRSRGTDIFSTVFAWNLESVNVDWNGELEPAEVLMASGDFYSTLGIRAAVGRMFSAEDDRIGGGPSGMVAVISYACWQGRFGGDSSVIGRIVRIDRQPFTIVGVAPRGFFGVAPGLAPEITIPLTTLQDAGALASTTSSWLHLMGRMNDGAEPRAGERHASAHLAGSARSDDEPGDAGRPASEVPRPADRRSNRGRRAFLASGGSSREPLWILFALVGLLFVVACASAANLLLARGVARQREIAVRLAIGASRVRLVRQLFTESLVSAALAAGLGVLLATWAGAGLIALMSWREQPIVLDVSPSWRVMLFAFALTLVTVVICSVLPAIRTTRLAPGATLKDHRTDRGRDPSTLVARKDAHRLSGGDHDGAARGGGAVRAQPDERAVAGCGFRPRQGAGRGHGCGGRRIQGRAVERLLCATSRQARRYTRRRLSQPLDEGRQSATRTAAGRRVSPSMAAPSRRRRHATCISTRSRPAISRTLGMRVLQGRDFALADAPGSTRVVIVNESLARRFFPNQNPIGRLITIGRSDRRRNLEIIGLVQDAKYQTLQEPARRIAYLPITQQGVDQNLFAEVRPVGHPSSIVEQVRREVRGLDPGVPVRIETVTDRIRESLVKERVMALLASGLGVTALALACAGLYGLLAYAVSRQAKEIGLRLALGANRAGVLWIVLRDCLIVALVGITIGAGMSLALGRFARDLLYLVKPTDAISLTAAAVLMLVVALAAGFLPARRASRVDPVVALRCE